MSTLMENIRSLKSKVVRSWNVLRNIGVTEDLSLWHLKRTRLVNGVAGFALVLYTFFIIGYLGQEGLITSIESAVAFLFFMLVIILNYFHRYIAAIIVFNASATIIFMYYAIAHGQIDGAEYLLMSNSVAAMIFFRRPLPVVIFFLLNLTAFWICKYSFTVIDPIIVLPNDTHLYIENHIATFLGLFFIVYYFQSENLRQETELTEKNDRLQELDEMKSNFFANISHEFRTPLTMILSPLDELKSIATNAKEATLISTMERNANMLLHNVNELLDLSKLNAGKLTLHLEKRDIVKHLRGLVQSYDSFVKQKNIELRFSSTYEELDIVYDVTRVEQIIQNLISNAFKFTPSGGKIEWLVYPYSEDKNFIEVSIRDSGVGITKEHLAHIFDRFYQVDDSITRNYQGTGIGLALVKELVELQGGTIRAQSNKDQGSKFIFSLPMNLSAADDIQHSSDRHLSSVESKIDTGVYNNVGVEIEEPLASSDEVFIDPEQPVILIVEDNKDVREFIKYSLEDKFNTIEAADGETGIEKALEHIPDLIISDVMMPGIDGYQLCRTLKSDVKTAHIPLVLLTARAAREDRLEGLELGADDYLIKPFDSKELHVRINNLIANRKRLQQAVQDSNYVVSPELDLSSLDEQFMNDVYMILEKQYGEESFTIQILSEQMNLSERQMRRKLKAITGITPNILLRDYRLNIAKQLLENKNATVIEIAYAVGFSSSSYFSKCFKEKYNMSPSEMLVSS